MEGEVRVTVIATGFDRAVTGEPVVERGANPQVLPFQQRRTGSGAASAPPPAQAASPAPRQAPQPFVRPAPTPVNRQQPADVADMEIPTFIRRQMD
jgi:hypothetical protein